MDDPAVKNAARARAVEALADWTAAHFEDESVVVVSWLVLAEVMTSTGRRVSWVTGNGNDPSDEDGAGLMRWQIRGLLSEVEDAIQHRDAQ